MPHEARIRNLTYMTEVFADVEVKRITYGDDQKVI